MTGHALRVAAFIASVEKLKEGYRCIPYCCRVDLKRFREVARRTRIPQRLLVGFDIPIFRSRQFWKEIKGHSGVVHQQVDVAVTGFDDLHKIQD